MGDFEALAERLLTGLIAQQSPDLLALHALVSRFDGTPPVLPSLQSFLVKLRDPFFSVDSTKRALILRAIRFCVLTPACVKALISEEIHWLVVESLERDSECTVERIQALKLMDKVRKIDPDHFPVAFGRSIIAVANAKDDAFRKIAVESLRELAAVSCSLVASLHGFATLMDAIMDPITPELADNITLTLLYLLNDPTSRRVVDPCVDMRMLLAPFTDLDSDPGDMSPKWNAAKAAFSLIMKSWVGIVLMASDENALRMLVQMLKDPKIPFHTQDVILETISDVFSNICFKVTYASRRDRHEFCSPLAPGIDNTGTGLRSERAESSPDGFRDTIGSATGSFSAAPLHGSRGRSSFTSLFGGNHAGDAHMSSATATMHASNTAANGNTSRSSLSSYLFGSSNSRSGSPAGQSKVPAGSRKSISLTTPNSFSSPKPMQMERISEEDLIMPGFQVDEFDPVYNLLDNLSALLCCAFLHVDLIDSLFQLSTSAKFGIASKSRKLLVSFLRILSEVLPDNACAELLTTPALIDFAASLGPSGRSWSKAHKASQLLVDLAEAFSIMPSQQTNGAHASSLTSQLASSKGRNGSITGKSAALGGSMSSGSASVSLASNKSNFMPLNIRTVFELAQEIKISSLSAAALSKRQESQCGFSSSSSRALSALNTLRVSLTPSVDKADFSRQMDLSRVIGKEGKEPFKWDWVMISDMLEYSFHSPDRLAEALRTKWVRRVSGFYRCSIEEKGYFANLEWEPTHLQYLECACNLYSVLLRDESGLSFLTSDRRGMLFNEMAHEIEQLVTTTAGRGWLGAMSPASPSHSSTANKSVFRMYSCNHLMARELFTLLGRIVRTPGSRKLLEHTNLFEHLSRLGQFKSLDYVTRLAITSLCFTDGGLLSRHLLQLWTTNPALSPDFRQYLHTLLRVMIQSSSSNDSYNWSVEAVVNQLAVDDSPGPELLKAVEESIHSKSSLRIIISKRPSLIDEPNAQHILLRFLAVREGIDFLVEKKWLDDALTQWHESRCKEYVLDIEGKISASLSQPSSDFLSDELRRVEAIPVRTPEILREITSRQGASGQGAKALEDGGRQAAVPTSDPNASLSVDLQGFMRIPWSIEVKMTGTALATQYPLPDPVTSAGEYLRIDAFFDISGLQSPLNFDITSDANRIVKVRGIVLDGNGNPSGRAVPSQKSLAATLIAGVCPLNRNGEVQGSADWHIQRRRASTVAHKDEPKSGSRGSYVASGGPAGVSTGPPCASESASCGDDLPVTIGQEHMYDWSICKPSHRQGSVLELEDGLFAVNVPGEPVTWIFSRRPTLSAGAASGRPSMSARGSLTGESYFETRANRSDTSRAAGIFYLVEVQFCIRLETGNGVFVPMPRHIYGELARTPEGLAHMARRNVVHDLVSKARQMYDQLTRLPGQILISPAGHNTSNPSLTAMAAGSAAATLDLRAWLWSLGHISATELGLAAIQIVDPAFVEWCIEGACSCPFFNIRGTFFHILGLISRTSKGGQRLHQQRWDCSLPNSNCAVAIPRQAMVLFKRAASLKSDSGQSMGLRKPKLHQGRHGQSKLGMPYLSHSNPPSSIRLLTPFIPAGSVNAELEVLNLIAKMPGVILYRESKSRLEAIRKADAGIFDKHSLYVDVHRILESYNFKLTARREILALFSPAARKRPQLSGGGSSSNLLMSPEIVRARAHTAEQ